jgi:hypothetical protein
MVRKGDELHLKMNLFTNERDDAVPLRCRHEHLKLK